VAVQAGRPPKLNTEQVAELLTKLASGAHPLALAKEYGVSDQTIYRHARLAKERAWDIESAGQARDGGEPTIPTRPAPALSHAEFSKAHAERLERASGTDPLTGVATTLTESDNAICRNVTKDLYAAFRTAGREKDYKMQNEIGKTIAQVVRARHRIAPPKINRGPLKTYTVEASPDVWPDPPTKEATK